MSKKIISIILISHIAAIGAGVYGGMKYAESNPPAGGPQGFARGDFSAGGGSVFGGQNLRNSGAAARQNGGVNVVAGEIIAKDENSITVRLRDGGSKIIFYSGSTEIGKFTDGDSADLEAGKTVSVSGKANFDGSVTAQSIQIRPEGVKP